MLAARCSRYGPPDVVEVVEVDDLVPGPGQVLIDIHRAAVNFPDVLIVADKYQVSAPVPFIPGSELAGLVAAVGDGVEGFAPGDRVVGTTFVGAFAQQVVLPAHVVDHVPEGVDLSAAAAFGVAHATAYHALRSVADVQADEWVVVLGAAGGVGLAAVELATLMGARVVAAASTPEKLDLCRARGAVATVDYTTEDLKVRLKELTGGGADVVIDPVGGAWSEPALRAMRHGGRFVVVGFASGEIPRIPLNLVLLKGVVVTGFEMLSFLTHHADEARRDRAEMLAMLADGRVQPHVSATYPLGETAAALQSMLDRTATGKVLIDPRS